MEEIKPIVPEKCQLEIWELYWHINAFRVFEDARTRITKFSTEHIHTGENILIDKLIGCIKPVVTEKDRFDY